jgi:hypothetical protein
MRTARHSDADGAFSVTLPDGWDEEPDEEGGLLLAREEGAGLLHLVSFSRESLEFVDPAEELYAFLAEHEIHLEEDEVEDIELRSGGVLAYCEYATEEDGESVYWLVAVAAAPGQLVFASYSCPLGEEDEEREVVREILTTLQLESEPLGKGDQGPS